MDIALGVLLFVSSLVTPTVPFVEGGHLRTADQEMRNQEVLRANRELAAYFKGRRTEREARAALKTIKAFVRDRERQDAKSRPPLPGADAATTSKETTNRKASSESSD